MNTITTAKLAINASPRQRSVAALGSLLITVAVVAGNLQIAQGYAHPGSAVMGTAQVSQAARG